MKIVPPSTKRFSLWISDAATEFANGCLDGMIVGSGGGIFSVARTDTTDPSKLILNGLLGFLGGMALSGISAFKVWHKTNRIPNPFRDYGADLRGAVDNVHQ